MQSSALKRLDSHRNWSGHGNGYGPLLGNSAPMQKLFHLVQKVSQSRCPVVICGESGTGKEMVARLIHESGPLADRPFVPVDCGTLVPTLMESELFGHVRGAFTGAVYAKQGLLEVAYGGTVFLDEIAELPVDLQVKLLRSLQEKEIRPVGSTRRVRIDVRVIAATNRELESAIQGGNFRRDLYYRLNVVNLRLPPLRERKSDIPLLAEHFLEKFKPPGRPHLRLSEDAVNRLMAHDWPGNVRELENCIERAVVLSSGPVLHAADISTHVQDRYGFAPGAEEPVLPLQEMERQAIMRAILQARGDKLRAAELLKIGKTTLYRKLREYNHAL